MEFNFKLLFVLLVAYAATQLLILFVKHYMRTNGKHKLKNISHVNRFESMKVYTLLMTAKIRWNNGMVDDLATIEIQIYFEQLREVELTISGRKGDVRVSYDFTQNFDALQKHFRVDPMVATQIDSEILKCKNSLWL